MFLSFPFIFFVMSFHFPFVFPSVRLFFFSALVLSLMSFHMNFGAGNGRRQLTKMSAGRHPNQFGRGDRISSVFLNANFSGASGIVILTANFGEAIGFVILTNSEARQRVRVLSFGFSCGWESNFGVLAILRD